MKTAKKIHYILFIIGLFMLVFSLLLAFLFNYPYFYTLFVWGLWLTLDWLDYQMTKKSILGYFLHKKRRKYFLYLFILTGIFCFIIDYTYGVQVSRMWKWTQYSTVHYIQMYLFMNIAFILSSYEIYRVIKTILKRFIKSVHVVKLRLHKKTKKNIYTIFGLLGIAFFLSPVYAIFLNTSYLIEYVMLLPFIAMILVSDAINYYLGGNPLIKDFYRFNPLIVFSIILTWLAVSVTTEFINLYANEWTYTLMPFGQLKVANVPIAVFIGWLPLIASTISAIRLVKRIGYIDQSTP